MPGEPTEPHSLGHVAYALRKMPDCLKPLSQLPLKAEKVTVAL